MPATHLGVPHQPSLPLPCNLTHTFTCHTCICICVHTHTLYPSALPTYYAMWFAFYLLHTFTLPALALACLVLYLADVCPSPLFVLRRTCISLALCPCGICPVEDGTERKGRGRRGGDLCVPCPACLPMDYIPTHFISPTPLHGPK